MNVRLAPASGSGYADAAQNDGFNDTFHSQMSELSTQEQRLQNELKQMEVGNGKRKHNPKRGVNPEGQQLSQQRQQGSARFGRRAAPQAAA